MLSAASTRVIARSTSSSLSNRIGTCASRLFSNTVQSTGIRATSSTVLGNAVAARSMARTGLHTAPSPTSLSVRPLSSLCLPAATTDMWSRRYFHASRAVQAIYPTEKMRNVAIIAHVDHGKTTLVDELLSQSGTMEATGQRVMDSNVLEKERGITILSKITAVNWKDYRINIVDTPGHADFGGEVERVLHMVDGVLLIVDATEGPMAQTKFVLSKALANGLNPVVVLNKVDRETARLGEVENEIFDLFCSLDANDDQLEFPTLYASAKQGWAVPDMDDDKKDMQSIFETIIESVPYPKVDRDAPFSMLVTMTEKLPFVGKVATGRIRSGTISLKDDVQLVSRDGTLKSTGKVFKILARRGLDKVEVETAAAGDMVSIAGLEDGLVTDSILAKGETEPIPTPSIDPPTLAMTFSVNDSPLSGREGKQLTSNAIATRLYAEAEVNVAVNVSDVAGGTEVKGRGELQMGILLENMRREGFEMNVSQPRILMKEVDGKIHEPIEELTVDVDEEYSGAVIQKLGVRKGELENVINGVGKTRLIFTIPSRGLIGYRSEFDNDTHGTGVMNSIFKEYAPYKGDLDNVRRGAIISTAQGTISAYALATAENRGSLFVGPGTETYTGMIIGESSRAQDVEVNPVKTKQLTNMRAAGSDENIKLTPPRIMTLENALAWLGPDELLEVTPGTIRLRKAILDPGARKNSKRDKNKP